MTTKRIKHRAKTVTEHFVERKATLPSGTILLYLVGDFYETFHEDAQVAHKILGVALTRRQGVPMCGFPKHAQDKYLQSLKDAGHTVVFGEIQKA